MKYGRGRRPETARVENGRLIDPYEHIQSEVKNLENKIL